MPEHRELPMDLLDVCARVWRTRWRALALALLACVIAIAMTYSVSVSPFGLHPRALRFGVAEADLLVDAGRSPLAQATVPLDNLENIASDVSNAVNSNFVLAAVGRSLHVSPAQIGVQQQVVQNVPRTQSQAQEAQVGTQLLASEKHYSILVRNDQGTFVIQLFTQAPTGREAIGMASAASSALSSHVARLAAAEHIPVSDRLILRQLGPTRGGLVDPHGTQDAAVLIAIIAWVFLMIAGFTWDHLRARPDRTPRPASAPTIPDLHGSS